MYHPRQSHYCKIPAKRHIRHPLEAIVHRAYHVPSSYHANFSGRKVLPPATDQIISLPKPTSHHDLPLYLDSSMLSTWRSCRRKHYWSTIRGLYPSGKSVHLVAGAAVAAGLEAARRFCFTRPDPTQVHHADLVSSAYPAFCEEWGDYNPPDDNPRNAKTFVNTFSALSFYLEEYHPGRDLVQPLLREDGSPCVEYRFAIPLPCLHPSGDPFIFVGRFDLLGTYNFLEQKIPIICDEKTASSFTQDWSEKWDLRGQFLGYIWALRQQGFQINSAIIRGIAIQKTQYQNRSAFIQYPNHLIDGWYQQLLTDVEEIKSCYLSSCSQIALGKSGRDPYSMDFADACDSYGGCAFRTLCSVYDPEDFTTNYIPYIWDPLAKQPVKESS